MVYRPIADNSADNITLTNFLQGDKPNHLHVFQEIQLRPEHKDPQL